MISSIGALVDQFKGFFNRSFFLSALLPTIIFLSLNFALACMVFPSTRILLHSVVQWEWGVRAVATVAALLASIVLALVLWSLQPLLVEVLEGYAMTTEGIRRFLKSVENRKRDKVDGRFQSARVDLRCYRMVRTTEPTWEQLLKSSRLGGPKLVTGPKYAVPQALVKRFTEVEQIRKKWGRIPFSTMEAVLDVLMSELSNHDADLSKDLDALHQQFLALLEYASAVAESDYDDSWAELTTRFPLSIGRMGPTPMANISAVHREYGLTHYGLDIEVLWLRLLKIIRGDKEYLPILEDAKAQLDFAVATTVILAVITAIWSVLSLWAPSRWPFVAIFALGPPSVLVFYRLSILCYQTFTETVRGAIDLHRFDLLRALHLPLPPDSDAERARWASLLRTPVQAGQGHLVQYEHTGSAAPPTPPPSPLAALAALFKGTT